MNRSIHEIKDDFLQQLNFIDENIKELTELYIATTPIQQRIKHYFNLYILEVEELLDKNIMNISSIPKVFIGTKVTVWYEDEDETEDYVICFPEQSDPDSGLISFLSPVGKQLLLKSIGEKLLLKVPTGDVSVTIKDITYVGSLLDGQRHTKEA
ncbi:GreA/GreB family elongation factor [Bacillus sp. Marseille-P3661]|uniref:GreA/GreB family elongation factor n=1 Tax=Bacillus sp. Marseille-P3661 TaxID=1936234 RepID=UPI000C854667|nr:GreA/GreB family elongation factor [Bacillus sp. Marseille-P3661]